VAGVSVAAVALPVAVAYAQLAGSNPVVDFIDDEYDGCHDRWDDDDGDFLAGAIVGGEIVGTAAAASSSTTYVTTRVPVGCNGTEFTSHGQTAKSTAT
jgi:hypothetical protein